MTPLFQICKLTPLFHLRQDSCFRYIDRKKPRSVPQALEKAASLSLSFLTEHLLNRHLCEFQSSHKNQRTTLQVRTQSGGCLVSTLKTEVCMDYF